MGSFLVRAKHPLTRMLDRLRSKGTDCLQGSVELIVLRQLKIAPIRKERVHPVVNHWKNDADMPLDRIFTGFERVNILSKHQCYGGIDRKARQVPQGIDIDPSLRTSQPTLTQSFSNELQCGEKLLEPMWGKCACDETTLPAPCLSLERENTIHPDLGGNGLDRGQAPKAPWPIPQRGERDLEVGRHKDAFWA